MRRYRVQRPIDDPNYVMVDPEFDNAGGAEAFAVSLRDLWGRVDVIGENPRARIVDAVETKEF